MANHVLRQIRDQAKTALTGLATTGSNAFVNRSDDQSLQDAELPALLIRVRESDAKISSMGTGRVYERSAKLEVTACVKQTGAFEDSLFTILKECEIALNSGQIAAKKVDIERIEIEDDAKGEKPIAVGRFTFDVLFYTALGSPDVAL